MEDVSTIPSNDGSTSGELLDDTNPNSTNRSIHHDDDDGLQVHELLSDHEEEEEEEEQQQQQQLEMNQRQGDMTATTLSTREQANDDCLTATTTLPSPQVAVAVAAPTTAHVSALPTKEDFLRNEANPPLVTATLVPLGNDLMHENDAIPVNVQTLGPHTDVSTTNPTTTTTVADQCQAPQIDLSQQTLLHPPLEQHTTIPEPRQISDRDLIRVYVDDDGYNDHGSAMPPVLRESKNLKSAAIMSMTWKKIACISILIIIFILIALVTGISISKHVKQNNNINITTTTAPTTTASPSLAPSCVQGFHRAWTLANITSLSLPALVVAADSYDSSRTLGVVPNYNIFTDNFTFHTFVWTESGGTEVEIIKQFQDSLEIQALVLSDDGATLVAGVHSYFEVSDGTVGGAFLIFKRLNHSTLTWNLTHVQRTYGDIYGTVFDVAVSSDGSTVAVSAGMLADVSLSFGVSVYRVSEIGLELMGNTLLENLVRDTKIELSGDGTRLFLTTADSRLQIFDFSIAYGWTVTKEFIFEGSNPVIQVSRDGDILAIGNDNWYPVKVYALMDGKWDTMDSVGRVDQDSYNFKFSLSKDGNNLFLSGIFSGNGTQNVMGEWFRRGSNGFQAISSVTIPGTSIINVFFNEQASQLLFATDFGLTGFERICASSIVGGFSVPMAPVQTQPTNSPAPTGCISGLEYGWYNYRTKEIDSDPFLDPLISISKDGSTLVIARTLYNASTIRFATFDVSSNRTSLESEIRLTQSQCRLHDMDISGDGRTLLFGVDSYLQADGTIGGAFPVYHRSNASWAVHATIETGGGVLGAVFDVSISDDGAVVAFSAGEINGSSYADVYAVEDKGLFHINEQGFPRDPGDGSNNLIGNNTFVSKLPTRDFTQISLSGSGSRLFIIATTGAIRSFDFDSGCACWTQIGQSVFILSEAKLHVSFDGNTIVNGIKYLPITIYDFIGEYWEMRESSSYLDDKENESSAQIALSSDGQSIFVARTYDGLEVRNVSGSNLDIIWNQVTDFVDEIFNTTVPSWNNLYSVGQFYKTSQEGSGFLQVETNLPLLPGVVQQTTLTGNGNLFVVTNETVSFYQNSCA